MQSRQVCRKVGEGSNVIAGMKEAFQTMEVGAALAGVGEGTIGKRWGRSGWISPRMDAGLAAI